MLESYGLHSLIWNTRDERFGDVLIVSPADVGRCGAIGWGTALERQTEKGELDILFKP